MKTPIYIEQTFGLSSGQTRNYVLPHIKEGTYSKHMRLNGNYKRIIADIADKAKTPAIRIIAQNELNVLNEKAQLIERAVQSTKRSVQLSESFVQPIECSPFNTFNSIERSFNVLNEEVQRIESELNEVEQDIQLTKPKFNWLNDELTARLSNWKFDSINILDIGLIFIGLVRLYALPGAAVAVMASLFLLEAQAIAKNPELRRSNDNTLGVVLSMCIASFFLHFITFWNATEWLVYDPESINGLLKIAYAIVPAAFVSVLSYKAVETTNKKSKENYRLKKENA